MYKFIVGTTTVWLGSILLFLSSASVVADTTSAEDLLSGGWILDSESSELTFQSIKNGSKIETSRFASFSGEVNEQGIASLIIQLDSVDTAVDLRNVRMRFLFFETFKYPTATVTARVSAGLLEELSKKRRIKAPVEFDLNLHGEVNTLTVETTISLFADDQLSITSVSPVNISADLFALTEGVNKLQDTAKVTIVPSGVVSFDFVFSKNNSATGVVKTAAVSAASQSTAAVETIGEFSQEECEGRFEILSQTGAIFFRSGSAELDSESEPLLRTVLNVINRCPSLRVVVAGHTDSNGSETNNLRLSKARAISVQSYLASHGVEEQRIRALGFGESSPVAPNDTQRNKRRNRRIEFAVDNS